MSADATPPPHLEAHILYKLGGMESLLSNGFLRIDEQMHRIGADIQEVRSTMRSEIAVLQERVGRLESWRGAIVAKISIVTTLFAVGWIIFGSAIEKIVGGIF